MAQNNWWKDLPEEGAYVAPKTRSQGGFMPQAPQKQEEIQPYVLPPTPAKGSSGLELVAEPGTLTGIFKFTKRTGSEQNFRMLPAETQAALISAGMEYQRKTGKQLQINSAFRPEEDQARLYEETVKAGRPGRGPTGMPVAKPGKSQHAGGIAVDIQQGIDDPIARGILNQYGFVQPIKNDPVHFEMRGGGPKPRGRIGPQPGGFMGSEGPAPTLADVAGVIPKGAQNVGVLAQPIARGMTGGLTQYLEAATTQKKEETFSEALQRTRETYAQRREAFPAYQIGGEILGSTLSSIIGGRAIEGAAKGAGAVTSALAGAVIPSAALAGTSTYTAAPETTLAEAAGSAATAATVSGVLAGAGLGASEIVKNIGSRTLRKNVENLISKTEVDDPAVRAGAEQQLQRIFGQRFDMAKKYSDRPHWQNIFGTATKEEAKTMAQSMTLTDFAKLMVKDAENLTFARDAAKGAAMEYRAGAKLEKETAKNLAATILGQEVRGVMLSGGATTLGGLAGYYGAGQVGMDPTLGALLGAGAGSPLAYKLAAGKSAAAGYALSPSLQAQVYRGVATTTPAASVVAGRTTQELITQKPGQTPSEAAKAQQPQPVKQNWWLDLPEAK